MVFVDTSAWFAYFSPSDSHHTRVRDWIAKSDEELLTTDFCVDETLTLLVVRGEFRRALEAGTAFFRSDVCRLHFVAPEEIRRAWLIFQQRSVAGWSFTDCTSKVVIDDLRIETAISLDAHFAQFGDVAIAP